MDAPKHKRTWLTKEYIKSWLVAIVLALVIFPVWTWVFNRVWLW